MKAVHTEGDFIDCYSSSANVSPRDALEEIILFPGWARALLAVRRLTTTPFGLSQDGPVDDDKIGSFPVVHETSQEIVAGFDDKHLNFRVAVIADGKSVSLTTWVHPHGLPGRIYLSLIMPFHIMIARDAVWRVAKKFPTGSLSHE
ncbi:DUF2867 domain-containing protein [Phaeobacter piscinae]|uniref:DUF2867 domain-containing protein n=1 Tax=Phaeobacter piscinae TaxID=1580596 RepID=UPI000C99ED63|nr:DUF2867 domain-containing protein [Phaeobacter piscinae]